MSETKMMGPFHLRIRTKLSNAALVLVRQPRVGSAVGLLYTIGFDNGAEGWETTSITPYFLPVVSIDTCHLPTHTHIYNIYTKVKWGSTKQTAPTAAIFTDHWTQSGPNSNRRCDFK